MKRIIFTLCVALVVQACNQNNKEQDQLFKEVMAIHDEVMPKMGTLRKLSKQIELQLDSLEVGNTQIDNKMKRKMESAVKKLDDANESMMEWMRQFEQLEEGTPHEEALKYLKDQKQLMEKVRDNMLTAKKEGEQFTED